MPIPNTIQNDPSIVNYLNRAGKASDYGTRAKLALNSGINNYTGTAEQNTSLLGMLRSKQNTLLQSTTPIRQTEKKNITLLNEKNTAITNARNDAATAKLAQDTINAQTANKVDTTANAPAPDPYATELATATALHTQKVKEANDRLDSAKILLNDSNKALIDNIKRTYENRISEMEKSNKALLGTVEQSGFRSGRARYIQKTQAGVLSSQEKDGILRVSQLEGEMLSLVSKAENARNKGQFDLLNKNMAEISKLDTNLQDSVLNLHKLAIEKQKEANAKDKLAADQQKVDFAQGLKVSERSAPMLAQGLAGLGTPEKQAEYISAVAEKLKVPVDVLWGDVLSSMDKNKKAQLDIQNIESRINDRATRAKIYAFSSDTARMNADTAKAKLDKNKTASGFSIATENILQGVSTLADVSKKNKEKVKSELQGLGFYSDTPQQWYIDFKNNEANQTLLPDVIKKEWEKYKKKVLADNSSTLIVK